MTQMRLPTHLSMSSRGRSVDVMLYVRGSFLPGVVIRSLLDLGVNDWYCCAGVFDMSLSAGKSLWLVSGV